MRHLYNPVYLGLTQSLYTNECFTNILNFLFRHIILIRVSVVLDRFHCTSEGRNWAIQGLRGRKLEMWRDLSGLLIITSFLYHKSESK